MKHGMRSTVRSGLLGSMMLLIALFSQAQEIHVSGGFLKDSIQIGESVDYYLVANYPQHLTVLFPDSVFEFTPFEYSKKTFFPTLTQQGISYDSVLYTLSTFEVDKIQYLSLPVFVTSARDCTAYEPIRDSVFLIELVKTPPPDSIAAQNLPLKTNTLYEKVFTQFNYIILMIIVVILVISTIFVWVVFGKKIATYFKLKRLQKNHVKFMNTFVQYANQLGAEFSREKTEATVSLWKKYLEQLEQRPYTKLTTRETIRLDANEQLGAILQAIDRIIYGNQTAVHEPLKQLQHVAEERFQKKLEQIKHG